MDKKKTWIAVIVIVIVIAIILILVFSNTSSVATPVLSSATAESTTSIILKWTSSEDVDTYNVYRNNTEIKSGIPKNGTNVISYTDSGLTENTSYTYYIKAVANGTTSDASNEVIAKTKTSGEPTPSPTPVPIPGVPNPTIVTAGVNYLTLSWTPITGTINYEINRTGSGGTLIFEIPGTEYIFTDTNLLNGSSYTYQIRAISESGPSEWGTVTGLTNPCFSGSIDAYGRVCGSVGGTIYWGVNPETNSDYKRGITMLNGVNYPVYFEHVGTADTYPNTGIIIRDNSLLGNIGDYEDGTKFIIYGTGNTELMQNSQKCLIRGSGSTSNLYWTDVVSRAEVVVENPDNSQDQLMLLFSTTAEYANYVVLDRSVFIESSVDPAHYANRNNHYDGYVHWVYTPAPYHDDQKWILRKDPNYSYT